MEPNKRFEKLVSNTILFETGGDKSGAYTDDPHDSGGATKWGISQSANPDVKIKTLTYKQAIQIYKTRYWNSLYDSITDDILAFKLFDMGVMMGPKKATELLQQALINKGGISIKVDGDFGPITSGAVTAICTGDYDTYQAIYNYYILLLDKRIKLISLIPKNWKYKKGWLTRVHFTFKEKKNANI